ncbi:MAG: hypothetical protein M3Y54_04720 [Bacteroidota bacterium]|nr:hypothetical protein [Bacteroidota bacterium]
MAAKLLPAAVRASQYLPPGQLRQLPPAALSCYYERVNTGHFRRRGGPWPDYFSLAMRPQTRLALRRQLAD